MAMATTAYDKKFWVEFIEIYKNLPALWKVKSEFYKNRTLKKQGYGILVKKMRELVPNADRKVVMRRINSLRTNYRRELRKVYESKKSGSVYAPTLWYFSHIDFLRCAVGDDTSIYRSFDLKKDSADIPLKDDIIFIDSKDDIIGDSSVFFPQSPMSPIGIDTLMDASLNCDDEKEEPSTLSYEHLRCSSAEVDILGKTWALEYKKLRPDQQIFARKAINDILFEARLGSLHRNSVKINDTL